MCCYKFSKRDATLRYYTFKINNENSRKYNYYTELFQSEAYPTNTLTTSCIENPDFMNLNI